MRMEVAKDVRLLQSVGKHQLLVAEQDARRSIGHDRPLIQDDGSTAKLHHHLKVVRGNDFCGRN